VGSEKITAMTPIQASATALTSRESRGPRKKGPGRKTPWRLRSLREV
jgi:hypothetical protein